MEGKRKRGKKAEGKAKTGGRKTVVWRKTDGARTVEEEERKHVSNS